MSGDYGFTVTAAGSPKDCNSGHRKDKPVILLSGGSRAHYGVVIGVGCRLVADPASPLKFSGIGELLPMLRRDVNEAEREGDRWVVLEPVDKATPWPKELFAEQVRLEYDPVVLAAAQARHARPRSG